MNFLGFFLFLFLVLLSTGTFTYLYIIWTTYWQRVAKVDDSLESSRSVVRIKYDETTGRFIANEKDDSPQAVSLGSDIYQLVDENYFYEDGEESEEMSRIKGFEKVVVSNLRRTFMEYGKKVLSGDIDNRFKVRYTGRKGSLLEINESSNELLCDMKKKVHMKIFQRGDPFFRAQQLDQYLLPESSLFSHGGVFNSCAIVMNSGSLINSELGTFIDSHDFVMRFNNAPTTGHEKDVGSKTSLRVVNSQILSDPRFGFLDPKNLYSLSPVLVWDPSNYNVSISEWYSSPGKPFFETFFSKRLMKPEEPLFLLHPGSLWSLWDWLQSHSKWPLVPNPTTSGFIGLALAVQHCSVIRIFEYIPSLRYSDKCHYYGKDLESEIGSGGPCTYGAWHPVSAEKLMALALNIGKKKEMFVDGYITIPGFHNLKC